ncbi:hypothetical protein BD414DRAFT_568524, partial [Trametes punicea]
EYHPIPQPVPFDLSDELPPADPQSILDCRRTGRRFEYLIHWKDLPAEEDSWTPLTDLPTTSNVSELLEQFHRRHPRAPRPPRSLLCIIRSLVLLMILYSSRSVRRPPSLPRRCCHPPRLRRRPSARPPLPMPKKTSPRVLLCHAEEDSLPRPPLPCEEDRRRPRTSCISHRSFTPHHSHTRSRPPAPSASYSHTFTCISV